MSPYRKAGHSATWYLKVTDAEGQPHALATGTHDRAVADAMEVMLKALAGRGAREWALIRALLEKDPARPHRRRLTLGRLYDAWRIGDRGLRQLRAELRDVDLAPAIDTWVAALGKTARAGTLRQYERNVRRLVAEDGSLRRSSLTAPRLAAARDVVPGSVANQLAHLTAWSSFLNYLVERGQLRRNPLLGGAVKWPREPKRGGRVRHIAALADVQRFVATFDTLEDRAIAALREGVGADWDALEPMRVEHILDRDARLVRLPGDKTDNRPREVEVEPWAWAHVAAYLRTVRGLPGAPLFTVPYETYKHRHNRIRDALIVAGVAIPKGYSPHNARHSFAVRKRRAGWPDWKIAAYLGNTAQEVARTYGHFQPQRADLVHDEGERRRALRRG